MKDGLLFTWQITSEEILGQEKVIIREDPTYEGGQEVMIVAEDQNGNKTYLKNILYDGYNGENAEKLKKYNFYYMQFFD